MSTNDSDATSVKHAMKVAEVDEFNKGKLMRKIEQQMVNAVSARKPWSLQNTTVAIDNQSGRITVYLYGHRIAYQEIANKYFLCIDEFTLNQYPTRTTLSRLRALGFDIQKKDGYFKIQDRYIRV